MDFNDIMSYFANLDLSLLLHNVLDLAVLLYNVVENISTAIFYIMEKVSSLFGGVIAVEPGGRPAPGAGLGVNVPAGNTGPGNTTSGGSWIPVGVAVTVFTATMKVVSTTGGTPLMKAAGVGIGSLLSVAGGFGSHLYGARYVSETTNDLGQGRILGAAAAAERVPPVTPDVPVASTTPPQVPSMEQTADELRRRAGYNTDQVTFSMPITGILFSTVRFIFSCLCH